MTLGVFMAVILPLIGLIFALSREASQAYKYLESAAAGGASTRLGGHPAAPIGGPLVGIGQS